MLMCLPASFTWLVLVSYLLLLLRMGERQGREAYKHRHLLMMRISTFPRIKPYRCSSFTARWLARTGRNQQAPRDKISWQYDDLYDDQYDAITYFVIYFFVAENDVLKLTFFLDKKILTKVISLQLFFYCKMRYSSTQTLSPKPAGQSQSPVTLQLHGVKLAITCNPFLIIQQLSVINRHIMLSVAVCIDKKNKNKIKITFNYHICSQQPSCSTGI